MATMRAAVFVEKNRIVLDDKPIPEVGPLDALVRITTTTICGTDVHILEGGFPGAYPLIPGHEFCGEVVEVGPGCSRIKVGDRVAVEPNVPCNNCPECLRGDHHYCRNMIVPGVNRPGGFGEYVVVLERGVFSVGDLDFAECLRRHRVAARAIGRGC